MLSLFPFSKKGDLASKTTTGIPFIKITISEQKKKDAKIYAFPGNLLEAYDIVKGDKISKDK